MKLKFLQNFSLFSLLIVGFFIFTPFTSHAQLNSALSVAGDITLRVTPEYPKPGDIITATLHSYLIDVEAYQITWKVNGKEADRGTGVSSIKTTVGQTGEETQIEAQIVLPTEIVNKKRSVIPGGLDILWESPYTYVPPFYKGKALPARESDIRVTAIPRIPSFKSSDDVSDYIFTWDHDFTTKGSLSGYGKSTYSFTNPFNDKLEIVGATVSNTQGTFEASDDTEIVLVEPEVVFYQETDDLGVRPQALTDRIVSEIKTLNLIAEPFYFSTKSPTATDLEFTWRIGDSTLVGPNRETLYREARIESSGTGQAFLGVKIDKLSTFFQVADEDLLIIFR